MNAMLLSKLHFSIQILVQNHVSYTRENAVSQLFKKKIGFFFFFVDKTTTYRDTVGELFSAFSFSAPSMKR